jgi:hypothetical protein
MDFYTGFDRLSYPGDDVMKWLKDNTNLSWAGFYLAPAPSQHNTSWMNKRDFLVSLGWGLSPIYVGQQIAGTPGSHNLTGDQGTTDAQNAAQLAIQAGFPADAVIFLDVEQGPPAQSGTIEYYTAWVAELVNQGFTPGVYCSFSGVAKSLSEADSSPIFWVFNVNTKYSQCPADPFPSPNPKCSKVNFACLWQFCQSNSQQTCSITVDGKTIQDWDFDSAVTCDPSNPATYPDASQVDSCTETPAQPSSPRNWPLVKLGDSSEVVKTVQYLLNEAGNTLDVNGQFDDATAGSVRSFQDSNHLDVDGRVGPNTWQKLVLTCKLNDTGNAVSAIQNLLTDHYIGFSGYADGVFDDVTESKVREFQLAKGDEVDGIVGLHTWRSLITLL